MYNSDFPTRTELPTSAQLIKSTIIALITAIVLLVTVVLPAEHAIDPTGIGRMLKLTEMGEIKKQLAAEAEADRIKDQQKPAEKKSSLGSVIAGWFISSAQAREIMVAQATSRSEELTISLKPGEGAEYKMTMKKGAKVNYVWEVTGGKVNYDMHGTPWSKIETSYKKDRGVVGDTGVLEAKFDGTHGWFWRNRDQAPITIKLRVNGDYTDLKKV